MIKIGWFLMQADLFSMDEFRRWWLQRHAPVLAAKPGAMFQRCIVNIRTGRDDLPVAASTLCEWDGMAEEWFESEETAPLARN